MLSSPSRSDVPGATISSALTIRESCLHSSSSLSSSPERGGISVDFTRKWSKGRSPFGRSHCAIARVPPERRPTLLSGCLHRRRLVHRGLQGVAQDSVRLRLHD